MLHEKLHAEKLGYAVNFQEAVQSSNAVSSTCLFLKVWSNHGNEVKQRGDGIIYTMLLGLSFNIINIENSSETLSQRSNHIVFWTKFDLSVSSPIEDTDET